jgi:pilus assembly protein Flp/PilA
MSQWMKSYFYVKNFAVIANEEEGQGLAEYGLIIALIAVVAIAGVSAFGDDITAFLTGLSAQLGM